MEYGIKSRDIYNMDEKGIQLGIDKRTMVLVERDQKSVQQVEDGNRELVTVIECVSADGHVLPPSVIFKAKTRDLQWGAINPCDARCDAVSTFRPCLLIYLRSVSISDNGWTDQDLGMKWIKKDFEPTSAARMTEPGWRLLILDGHNSHLTYGFIQICERNKILVICLPSHTTHRLQPCDVGVFRPLAASWKAEVNVASRQLIKINKYNILKYYHAAHTRAFTTTTIKAAFRKTGIWPIDPSIIKDDAFAPALNTTTKAAQPVPATLSVLLEEVDQATAKDSISSRTVVRQPLSLQSSSATVLNEGAGELPSSAMTLCRSQTRVMTTLRTSSAAPTPVSTDERQLAAGPESEEEYTVPYSTFRLVNFPPPLPGNSSRAAYVKQTLELRGYCARAKAQMEADHALKKLMDAENQRLRNRLFQKSKKPTRRRDGGSRARHMTGEENKIALAQDVWRIQMLVLFKELVQGTKAKQAEQQLRAKFWEEVIKKLKARQKTALQKAADEKKVEDAACKQRDREEAKRQKEIEATRKKAQATQKKVEKAQRDAAEKEVKARKKAERDEKAQKLAKLKAATQHKVSARKRKVADLEAQASQDENKGDLPSPAKRPRPRPCPRACVITEPVPLVPLLTGGPNDVMQGESPARLLGVELQNRRIRDGNDTNRMPVDSGQFYAK
jgi:hypothetical protein